MRLTDRGNEPRGTGGTGDRALPGPRKKGKSVRPPSEKESEKVRCYHLLSDGKCDGRYKGFACLGATCKEDKDPPCEHYVQGFYCSKYRRFGCVGISNCTGSVEDHARVRREKAKA